MVDWLKTTKEGVEITLHVNPGAKKSRILEINNTFLSISVDAPATESKANLAVLEFIGDTIGIKHTKLQLVRGHKCRDKTILVTGKSEEELYNILFISGN